MSCLTLPLQSRVRALRPDWAVPVSGPRHCSQQRHPNIVPTWQAWVPSGKASRPQQLGQPSATRFAGQARGAAAQGACLIITVLGGGNGSHAAVVDLILRGHWRRPGTAFPDGGRLRYRLVDELGVVTVENMSHDLAESINISDPILAPARTGPAGGTGRPVGVLTPGQVVAFTPGSFGTWLGADTRPDVAFLETATLPYLARLTGPAEVSIAVTACNLPVGSLPGRGPLADDAHARFSSVYPTAVRLRDGLDAALANWGPVIHPPLIIHNLGTIESLGKHFDIHAEGSCRLPV